jgi:hypothetical protein
VSKKEKALRALYDELGENILRADRAELEEDYRHSGRSIQEDAAAVKSLFEDTWSTFRKRALNAARERHREKVARIEASAIKLPQSPELRRQLFDAVIASQHKLGRLLTVQHRDFIELTDDDVESWLRHFGVLGLLPSAQDEAK